MQHIDSQMLATAINQLDDSFDTHAVEKRVLRLYPIAFANQLATFASSTDPLQQFSADFSSTIGRTFPSQLTKTRKVATENLGGLVSDNQEWHRSAPITSAQLQAPTGGTSQ